MTSDVLFLPDLARRLGLTEAAVRGHLRRGNFTAVPKPFRLGQRRLAWRLTDYETWLAKRAS